MKEVKSKLRIEKILESMTHRVGVLASVFSAFLAGCNLEPTLIGEVPDESEAVVETQSDREEDVSEIVDDESEDLTVQMLDPASGASSIEVDSLIKIEFSEDVDSATLQLQSSSGACSGSIQLSSDGFVNCVGGTISLSGDRQWTLTLGSNLDTDATFQIRITTEVKSQSGSSLASVTTVGSFSTERYCDATVITSVDSARICVSTEYSPESSYVTQMTSGGDGSPANPFNRLSTAIAAVQSGGIIYLGPGRYSGGVTLSQPVKVKGVGSASSSDYANNSVIFGTAGTGLTVASGTDATHRMELENFVVSGFTTGLIIRSYSTLSQLRVETGVANAVGIQLGSHALASGTESLTDMVIDDLKSVMTGSGNYHIRIWTRVGISNLSVTDSTLTGGQYGFYLANASLVGATAATNIQLLRNTYLNQTEKAIYLERFSSSTISDSVFTSSGTNLSHDWNCAIDINLKYGSYSDITVSNSTFTGGSLAMTGTTDVRKAVQLAVKARGGGTDTGYNVSDSPGATLSNVTLSNLSFSSTTNAIRIGEPGKSNPGPTGVSISQSSISATIYGLINDSTATVTAASNYWGSSTGACVPSGAEVSASTTPTFSCASGSRVVALSAGASTVDVSTPLTSAP